MFDSNDTQLFEVNNTLTSYRTWRLRPKSSYPDPRSLEQLTQGSLSQFTKDLAMMNYAKKQYIPSNIGAFSNEKLYSESIRLKKERNETAKENFALKN
jgi:hypothetical protein